MLELFLPFAINIGMICKLVTFIPHWEGCMAWNRIEYTFKLLWMVKWMVKQDLQQELGSGLPGRWRLRSTLPRSKVTRRKGGWWHSHGRNGGVGKKTNLNFRQFKGMDKNLIWQINAKTLYFDFLRFLAINFFNRWRNWNLMVYEIAIFDSLKGSPLFGKKALD